VTHIEVYEFHHLARKVVSDLEATWEPIIQMQIQDIELETNPDFMQITNPSEIVLLLCFEVDDEHVKGRIKLCYPYFTIQSILRLLDQPANEQMARATAGRGAAESSTSRSGPSQPRGGIGTHFVEHWSDSGS
jgi:flagellar motor switch protein FliM